MSVDNLSIITSITADTTLTSDESPLMSVDIYPMSVDITLMSVDITLMSVDIILIFVMILLHDIEIALNTVEIDDVGIYSVKLKSLVYFNSRLSIIRLFIVVKIYFNVYKRYLLLK